MNVQCAHCGRLHSDLHDCKLGYLRAVADTYAVNYWRELNGQALVPMPKHPSLTEKSRSGVSPEFADAVSSELSAFAARKLRPLNHHQSSPGRVTLTIRGAA